MKFVETPLIGAFVIEPTPRIDERGSFGRVFCAETFRQHELCDQFVQANHTQTQQAGTIRGLHYQLPPAAEIKLLRCVRGEIYDVIVDLRKDSPTFLKWHGVELNDQNRKMIYVPRGFAHGFQSLTDGCEVTYQSSAAYSPDQERQIRFDDPNIGIEWKKLDVILSPKDAATPHLNANFSGVELV